MSNVTINGLSVTISSPASNDLIGVWSTGGSNYGKATIANILALAVTGGGVVATGGFTLTVPATGTAALLATAQTFTKTQTIAPSSTSDGGFAINMPASSGASAMGINYNGNARIAITEQASSSAIVMADDDLGNGVVGCGLYLGRNTNGTGPAAGFVRYTNRGGTALYTWIDSSGNFRIGSSAPTNANDATGNAVLTSANLAAANVWTTTQNFNPSATNVGAMAFDMPSGTSANAFTGKYNGVARFFIVQKSDAHQFILSDADLGASGTGPGIYIGRNSNATPVSGFIRMTAKNGVDYYLWVGSDGKLHISSSAPTNATDTSATVVGTQS